MKEKVIATTDVEYEIQGSYVETKWNAIPGQFGRELKKVKPNKSDQSNDELYTNQWLSWDKTSVFYKLMKKRELEQTKTERPYSCIDVLRKPVVAEQQTKENKKSVFLFIATNLFLVCCLPALRPTLSHYGGESLTRY